MGLKLTNEEIEAIKYYMESKFENINQLLISDSRTDIAFLSDEKNEGIEFSYAKDNIIRYLEVIKNIYRAIMKSYLGKGKNWQPGNVGNLWSKYISTGVKGDAKRFMEYNYALNEDQQKAYKNAITQIYQYIVEEPGNYPKYYWSYLEILSLKKEFQKRAAVDR